MELSDVGDRIGNRMAAALQETIDQRVDPPNQPETIKRKQSDVPLIETGQMYADITFRTTEDGDNVIAEAGLFGDDNPESVEKAFINEYHPRWPRPFGRITGDTKMDRIIEETYPDLDEYFQEVFMK